MADSTFLYGANVNANGIRQHYLRYGGQGGARAQRDAVIIVPGITSPAVTWGFVGEQFGRQFDTYVPDVRGRGLSQAGAELDYSLDAQAADVIAFAKALGLQRYAIVGHSMGARIGIRAARSKPAGLTRLVLVDPPVSGPGRRPYPSQLPWYIDSIRLAQQGIDVEGMRRFCPTWTEDQLRLRAQWLHTCDERAILASFNGFHEDDIHTDLPHVAVPALLMTAGRGDVIREEDVQEMRKLLPALLLAHVANAGHMIPWDDEAGFYRAFGDFLGAALN
ncbi:2-succinyl-6-hydroxy-2,4-cyclohexadiene-1-carboxylate synthase MenH [Cupriavidus necator]|uniref:Alpha/beta hydrolase n=1 Tax=Cupriavidus necator (strain ATCC 17699 / DSM 428 / KCTC 22496 / NCIMB 10442 / H16 / Stanier 337) TaxID=381666 RepID=Q0KD51_CUPNH|nr:alpha/beta hydrolase [Cupriavidus necator]QCB99986.1 alpha/beta hydrolase [Cupriavidus necator H16]QQB77199.1 alpha/beta hydrolase [Cupriavidus necator]WKA41836.1 alpha/beta hydrolase [Cupriavidus necator]CAJ92070.1 hydrolase or acyltransferase (alpha/beta-hydrolase superfamily) [Cupriavidus necator H16]